MRVLMVGNFQHNGQIRHILNQGEELARRGANISVFLAYLPDKFKKEAAKTYTSISINNDPDISQMDLVHFHSTKDAAPIADYCLQNNIPYIITLHTFPHLSATGQMKALIDSAAAITTPCPQIYHDLSKTAPQLTLIPEGVYLGGNHLGKSRHATANKVKVAYIAEEGNYSRDSYQAVLKAVQTAGVSMDTVNFDKPISSYERYHGWPPDISGILRTTDIIITTGRTMIEGMACGNAVLVMGRHYKGILYPPEFPQKNAYKRKSSTDKKPCYKDIFYDLSGLIKDQKLLSSLQQQGRIYAANNHDLKVITPRVLQLYESIANPTN